MTAPIFIVGPPRSGTHLLRFCLSQHSRIYMAPETWFFIRVYGNRRLDRGLLERSGGAELVERILRQRGDPTMNDAAEMAEDLKAAVANARNYRDLAEQLFSAFAAPSGKPRWGEKTPLHALYLPQVFTLFPEAKVIFVLREPKNTIASTVKSGHVRADLTVSLATYMACRTARNSFADHPGVMSLDYETLVGETFEPATLSPGMVDSSYSDSVMERSENITIQPDDPEKWRRGLNEEEGAFIDAILSGETSALLSGAGRALVRERLKIATRVTKNRLGFFSLAERVSGR